MADWLGYAQLAVLVALTVGVLGCLRLLAQARYQRAELLHEVVSAREEAARLQTRLARLERIERRTGAPYDGGAATRDGADEPAGSRADRAGRRTAAAAEEYVITAVGAGRDADSGDQPTTSVPVDVLAREAVVRVAAFAYGVRRALDPEARNRIRFEIRREVKRARKARRAETREAVRQYRARARAAGRAGRAA